MCVRAHVCVCVCSGRIRINTSPKPPFSGPGRKEMRSAKKVKLGSARRKHLVPHPFLAGSKKVALLERKDKTHPNPRVPGGRAAIIREVSEHPMPLTLS